MGGLAVCVWSAGLRPCLTVSFIVAYYFTQVIGQKEEPPRHGERGGLILQRSR